ncbi:hypothetical protein KXQ82_17870 [Mucilaginibacter sp. HMF5004]|uniref:hypothetical protein n=1 Tax=Mucilaginibacter rivuli TaxID=2857527 RepID=UPI001C5E6709|nr:hypothetical protein [Mucilaginibacter rivuli]MBW4891599.1 hypothetical protein [Mucilaginibacter rivuli]
MRFAFDILTQVKFSHSYFSDGVFAGLDVNMDIATKKMMDNLGLMYKPFKGGFYILFDRHIVSTERKREDVLTEKVIFNFTLELKDPLFYNYTANLPQQIDKSIYYFRNSLKTTPGVANPLHNDEFVNEKDVVNLSDKRHHFFKKPFAKLSILVHPELETHYAINFDVRQTYWRYILVSDYLHKLSNPAIIDDKDGNIFGEQFDLELPDTKRVRGFVSANKMALSQRQAKMFRLVENYETGAAKHKDVIGALPYPDVRSISRLSVNNTNPANYSDIFIH